jgi:hypothetical protein
MPILFSRISNTGEDGRCPAGALLVALARDRIAASSSSVKTGTSLSPISGGLRFTAGLGRGSSGSSVVCHAKNCYIGSVGQAGPAQQPCQPSRLRLGPGADLHPEDRPPPDHPRG